jgi:hypothetical protein
VGRKHFVVVLVLVVAVAVALAVAAASRGDGKPSKPARPALMRGVRDDDANLMRRLQRDARARSQK